MKEQLEVLKAQALEQASNITNLQELQELKVKYLGKKGEITSIMKGMGALPAEERPIVGGTVNEVRSAIENAIQKRQVILEEQILHEQLLSETIDVTEPARVYETGSLHPLMSLREQMEDVFIGMGFEVAEGPEVENDYYNFEALNLPKEHPARDMQDSFYITEETLLRTHTSPVQIRTMEKMKGKAPVKIICPGKVYRRDDDDATHSHQFMQVEGLVIDKGISMADLKGILLTFAKKMFGEETKIRLRPSYFPFTEPSVEVDVSCILCHGEGCRVCKQSGWIEVLGAGMIHPNVLRAGGYDPEEVTGFAFGMGVERIAMLKHGVEDVRNFYTNDVRFLEQFE